MIPLKKWTRECLYSAACYKNKNKNKNTLTFVVGVFFLPTQTLRLTYQSLIDLPWKDVVSMSKYNIP